MAYTIQLKPYKQDLVTNAIVNPFCNHSEKWACPACSYLECCCQETLTTLH